MSPLAKIVSEIFMLILSVIAAPPELKEFRLDAVQHSGRLETMMVQRTDDGFRLFEQREPQTTRSERGTIRPVAGKPATYALKLGDGPEQTIDFTDALPGFGIAKLRDAQSLDLKAKDGVAIHIQRSGTAVYLTAERDRVTYVCH